MTLVADASAETLPLWTAAQLMADWWSDPTDTATGTVGLPARDSQYGNPAGEFAAAAASLLGLDLTALTAVISDLDMLADDHEQLMVGPGRAPCPPYESMWQDDAPPQRGVAMGSAAGAVLALYREAGLTLRPHPGELPDHIVVEWEAVAWSLEQDRAPKVAAALLRDHLALWIPRFCEQVAAHATHPYYKALAALTPQWTTALTDRTQTAAVDP